MRVLVTIALACLLLAGRAAASERVYDLPPGTRPFAVAAAPDGAIWYTAQGQGALGILDPTTGATRLMPLGENSTPFGLVVGPDGAAWIADGGQNALVRADPRDGSVSVAPLPADTPSASLGSLVFGPDGKLWFTGQNGYYGSLDPATRAMRLWQDPNGQGPDGIAAIDGKIVYASLDGSYLGVVEPASGAMTEIPALDSRVGPRRVAPDGRGGLWVSEWYVGKLARLSLADRGWAEWRLPASRPRAYALYVDDRGKVWVSDNGSNALWRFDPATGSFAIFPRSAPNAEIGQITGRPGEVWVPETGHDRLVMFPAG